MADLILKRGKQTVLQTDDTDYNRGLLVKLLDDGGYDVAYWYNNPDKPYPIEVKVDGESVKKDAKIVHLRFHPELKSRVNKAHPLFREFIKASVKGIK